MDAMVWAYATSTLAFVTALQVGCVLLLCNSQVAGQSINLLCIGLLPGWAIPNSSRNLSSRAGVSISLQLCAHGQCFETQAAHTES